MAQRKNSFTFDSTVDQEANAGLSVMVTFTVSPSILYLPLTPFPEKLPDVVSPLKVALFSFATLLASDTNVVGFLFAFMLKVIPSPRLVAEEGRVFLPLEDEPARPTGLRGRRPDPLARLPFATFLPPEHEC